MRPHGLGKPRREVNGRKVHRNTRLSSVLGKSVNEWGLKITILVTSFLESYGRKSCFGDWEFGELKCRQAEFGLCRHKPSELSGNFIFTPNPRNPEGSVTSVGKLVVEGALRKFAATLEVLNGRWSCGGRDNRSRYH